MNRDTPPFRWEGGALTIAVKVQPRAQRNQWMGLSGDHFRVRVAAPPVDGEANAQLVEFIADLFDVAPSHVELLSGGSARIKRLRISAPRRLPPQITTLDPM